MLKNRPARMVPARWAIMRKNSNISVGPELAGRESVASSLAEALKLHQAGRLADAERIYRRILATRPDNFDSLHLLGVIFYQRGCYGRGGPPDRCRVAEKSK